MGMLSEFKAFASRGNVVDLSVGIIIGGAFGKIVSSAVSDVLMPPLGLAIGGLNFTDLKFAMKDAVWDATGKMSSPAVTINYGNFLQTCVDFIIIAFAVFMIIRVINRFQAKQAEAPAPPSKQEILLTEIRDLLKSR